MMNSKFQEMKGLKIKALLFVGSLFLLGAINAMAYNREYMSYTENRRLADWPKLTLEQYTSGAYSAGIDAFIKDRFVWRASWIDFTQTMNVVKGVKDDSDFVLMTTEGANEAMAGANSATNAKANIVQDSYHFPDDVGMLIPAPPEQGVAVSKVDFTEDYKTNILIYDQKGMTSFVYKKDVIKALADAFNALGDNYMDKLKAYVMIAPSPVAFVSEDYTRYTDDQYEGIKTFYDQLDDSFVTIDAYPILSQHQDEYIYFRTDHHWTSLGAYYAYVEACKDMALTPKAISSFDVIDDTDFLGSIYNLTKSDVLKANEDDILAYSPKARLDYQIFTGQKTLEYDAVVSEAFYTADYKYNIFLGGDYGLSLIINEDDPDTDETLMVVKDSYGNALVPYFVNHFKQIVVVDLRYNTESLESLVNTYGVDRMMIVNSGQSLAAESYVNILENIN